MDILTLFLLYSLSQKTDFLESVKPLMQTLKNSEETLKFLGDLQNFLSAFEGIQKQPKPKTQTAEQPQNKTDEKPPKKENGQSPFQGIADELLQQYLDEYLSQQK